MTKIILLIFTVIFFTGCTTSSLKLNKSEELVFNYNSTEYLLTNNIESKELQNYKDLFVYQYKLVNEQGRVLFYENARTELNYEFNFGGLYTVMYLFNDSQEYEEVFSKNNLRLVQLTLKDKTHVNVLIQASDTQIYSYVYGFSNHEFINLARKLRTDGDVEIKRLKYQGVSLSLSQDPITTWNDKLVYFTPLIRPLLGMGIR